MDILTAKLGANMAQNDLKANGQIGYAETVVTTLVPETKHDFQPNEDLGGALATTISPVPFVSLEDKIEYTIKWNGVDYTCAAVITQLGNLGILGLGDDTGEPFIFLFDAAGIVLVAANSAGEVTFSVEQKKETVQPIDSKYFKTNLVYRLTTTLTLGEPVELNAVDEAALRKLAATSDMIGVIAIINHPVILCKVEDGSFFSSVSWLDGGFWYAVLSLPNNDVDPTVITFYPCKVT